VIPLAAVWLVAPRGRGDRPGAPTAVLALAVVLMLGYVVTAWSRGDLLALAATALLVILLGHRRWRETLLGLGVGAGAAVLALALLSPGTLPMLWDRVYPARAAVWTRALYIIGDHPFTGAGLDNFRAVARNSYPYFNLAFDQTEHAHSWPLQAGVDGSLLGIAAVLWLAAAFYVALWPSGRAFTAEHAENAEKTKRIYVGKNSAPFAISLARVAEPPARPGSRQRARVPAPGAGRKGGGGNMPFPVGSWDRFRTLSDENDWHRQSGAERLGEGAQ